MAGADRPLAVPDRARVGEEHFGTGKIDALGPGHGQSRSRPAWRVRFIDIVSLVLEAVDLMNNALRCPLSHTASVDIGFDAAMVLLKSVVIRHDSCGATDSL